MTKQKKYLYQIVAFLLLITLILSMQKYDISDITADNFQQKLGPYYKVTYGSLWDSGINNCIPDNISVLSGYDYSTSYNFHENGLNIKREEGLKIFSIEIMNIHTNTRYLALYKKNAFTPFKLTIQNLNNGNLLKEIVDKLIIQQEFQLKKTILKDGNDILIQENSENFIIVYLISSYEPNPPISLMFNSYSKRKFLKFIDYLKWDMK